MSRCRRARARDPLVHGGRGPEGEVTEGEGPGGEGIAGSALAGDQEVVCHNDLGPHNTVFRGEEAVGLIDWDEHVGPAPRLVDLGHAVSPAPPAPAFADLIAWMDRHGPTLA